jgi:hypothetical protein
MRNKVYLDEIVEIIELAEEYTIDIEVSGNRLFFANDILTHNSGYDTGDMDLTNTSESIGLPQTVDAMFALISTEELESMGQIMIKQLKNRWNDLSYYRRFVVGIDRSKMRLHDVEDHAQSNIYNEDSKKPDSNNTDSFKFDNNSLPKKKKLVMEGLK